MCRLILIGSLFGLFFANAIHLSHAAATESPGFDFAGTNSDLRYRADYATSEVSSTTTSSQADAESTGYEFAAPPATNANLIYRVNRTNGEVSACQFAPKGPAIGSTVCFPAGEGAGPQSPGDYGLLPSNFAQEPGLFRVNRQTGEMSVCYVLNERIVCTAPAR
jgi:hypothetical protein